jgi:hypothetical protein
LYIGAHDARKGKPIMAKISAKDTIVLINGYKLSTFTTAYQATSEVDALDATGFEDGVHNFQPGQKKSELSTDMLWSQTAGEVHTALGTPATGQVTLIPEGYTLGTVSLSMPYMQAIYSPGGTPATLVKVGSIKYASYGPDAAMFYGVALQHGSITNTLTGTGVLDPSDAAQTAACGAVLHVWAKTTTDTYVVKVQHSTDNSSWADLITFSADGKTLLAERQAIASGTINKYRRVVATRTGAAADTLSFTVHFFIK